jgi:hypothetical protein
MTVAGLAFEDYGRHDGGLGPLIGGGKMLKDFTEKPEENDKKAKNQATEKFCH